MSTCIYTGSLRQLFLELTDPCSVKPMIHDQSDVPRWIQVTTLIPRFCQMTLGIAVDGNLGS